MTDLHQPEPIVWSDDLSVGNPLIDAEHKFFITLINRSYECRDDPKRKGERFAVFVDLMRYVRVHFAHEEQLMLSVDYPDYERHRLMHEQAARKLFELNDRFVAEEDIIDEVGRFLEEWLAVHIVQVDRRFGDYLRSLEQAREPG